MAAEVRAHQLPVPGPAVLRVGGRVDARVAAAPAHVALECALLRIVEHVTGREQEDHRVVAREPRIGEHGAVLGRIDGDPVGRAELVQGAEGSRDRVVPEPGRFREREHAQAGLRGRLGRSDERHEEKRRSARECRQLRHSC